MSRFKIPLILFLLVFVISGSLSVLSGVSLFFALFKACVSSVISVVFLFVAKFLLSKYVPDLFENSENVELQDSQIVGASLDVRIGDEDSLSTPISSFSDSSNVLGGGKSLDTGKSKENLDAAGAFEGIGGEDSHSPGNQFSGVSGQEASESGLLMEQSNSHNVESVGSDLSSLEQNNVKENLSTSSGGISGKAVSENDSSDGLEKDVDRLEELPDLQEFVDSSSLGDKQTRGDELMNTGTQSFFETDLSENVTDTNLMANAIRTVLKREV